MRKIMALFAGLTLSLGLVITGKPGSPLHPKNVDIACEHLYEVMDRYHKSSDVYTEQDAGGNIYFPTGWMGDLNALKYGGDCLNNPNSGLTCIKIDFTANNNWAGIYWQYPENNWGTEPGYDLRGATKLTFWIRGENGGEKVRFFMAGITGIHPDPPQKTTGWITLNSFWRKDSIDVQAMDLHSIIGGFGFVTDASHNNNQNITFYLDDIQYDKQRLEKPRLLLSYDFSSFREDYPKDFANRNTAYTSDNALTMMIFMRDTIELPSEDWTRAKLIGDAFISCRDSDRYFHDGRLRNGYMTGDLKYRDTTRLPGWWDYLQEKSFENEYAVSSYTGNMAWAMIAWLCYHKFKVNSSYLNAAQRLGEWIHSNTYDTRGVGGYTRGFWGPDSDQQKFLSKSTEDNILVYSAFMMLYKATDDPKWRDKALHANDFVIAMWDSVESNFWPGTTEDGMTLLKDVVPLNVHTLAFMIFQSDSVFHTRLAQGIDWVYNKCRVDNCPRNCQFKGFDFNGDGDGVWFEGTAQMALAYKHQGNMIRADSLLEQLRTVQASARNGNGRGIVEACHDSVSTGFYDPHDNLIYKNNRLHIATTAWYICAESGFKPTNVELESELNMKKSYSLFQNYPNPFNTSTCIRYSISNKSHVVLKVYDLLGKEVGILVNEPHKGAGEYEIKWHPKNLPSGIYFYQLKIDEMVETKKMILLR